MQFLKRHYEKILLSLVLLALAGAAGWLMIRVGQIKDELKQAVIDPNSATRTPIVLASFAPYSNALHKAGNPQAVNISGQHRVFNPVDWQVKPDGSIIKIQTGKEIGPDAVVVAKITPLYLILTIEGKPTGTIENPGMQLGYERQVATNPPDRRKTQKYASLTSKPTFTIDGTNVTLTLKEAKGNYPDSPDMIFELSMGDTPQTITVSKDKPYSLIMGYAADLTYPPENVVFPPGKRVGETIQLGGVTYNIIAISDKQVVLSAPNEKRFPIQYKAGTP